MAGMYEARLEQQARREERIEIVGLMIEEDVFDWNNGLHTACLFGNVECAKLLIEKGANAWNDGLRAACSGGHIEMVKLMIEKGADDWYCSIYNIGYGGQENYQIYKLLLRKDSNIFADDEDDEFSCCSLKERYEQLVIEQDPLYTIITHYNNNASIKKLPFELWRMLKDFL